MGNLTLYESNRHLIQTGDEIEWHSDTLLGGAIRVISPEVNHTSICILFPGYYTDRVFQIEALEHGMVLTCVSHRLENHPGQAYLRPLRPEFNPVRREMGRIALDFAGTQIKYDYKGAFLENLFGRAKMNADRLFCTEAWYFTVSWAALASGSQGLIKLIRQSDKWLKNKAPRPADVRHLGLTKGVFKLK